MLRDHELYADSPQAREIDKIARREENLVIDEWAPLTVEQLAQYNAEQAASKARSRAKLAQVMGQIENRWGKPYGPLRTR